MKVVYPICCGVEAPPTPVETLKMAYDIARQKLKYVYLGNLDDPAAGKTLCPACGRPLIERHGYTTDTGGLTGNKCRYYELGLLNVVTKIAF